VNKNVNILLVEDNPGDVLLTQEAMRDSKFANKLHVVRDGVEALAFLHNHDAPTPDLILLDLNLPRMDGNQFLASVKSDPEFRRIPVVVLTTSADQKDVLRTYDLHANCYITKPVDLSAFGDIVQAIDNFWFNIVRLP
jgi:two-component system, chemotaxis family, response regulator Rcp1